MAAEAADLATEFEPAAVGEGRRRALRPTRTRLGDFFTNVGQTVGGAFDMFAGGADARLEGMRERSQTELAMENARKAREEARRLEAQRYADMNLESDLSIARIPRASSTSSRRR